MKVTASQEIVLEALCQHGTTKGMARALGVPVANVRMALYRLRTAHEIQNDVLLALTWDRLKKAANGLQLPRP